MTEMSAPQAKAGVASNHVITGIVDVTPNDGADLPLSPARGFLLLGAGDIRLTTEGGQVQTLTGLQAGVPYPFAITRVHATGTNATGIKALY